MTKRFASIAALVGLVSVLLLGANSAQASTSTSDSGAVTVQAVTTADRTGAFDCFNTPVNIITCNDILNDVTVIIKNVRVLNDLELTVLENFLNDLSIDVGNVEVVKNLIVVFLKDVLNIDISHNDIEIDL
ncbi:hypothetical protein ALI144C_31660 [Actinosynnema sp. ALI-1.44]|uniref:hypothetical protein n=1 Tax=Actinosynnema sp. ALI-1.44 TaxID=1933779 RepID=UPI00097CA674|nr:hypothetical protein [Actinosynnema sp. ALI-1.44]ONI77957.1 hypothetical protein ALI144C_31660 [Actinosynnema sp. ALI-1.44]